MESGLIFMGVRREPIFAVKILNTGRYGRGFQIFKTLFMSQKNQGLLFLTSFITLGSSVL